MAKRTTLSEDHKMKISKSLTGKKKKFSDQAIENIRNAAAKRRGVPAGERSDEVKKKISLATSGKSKKITQDNRSWFQSGHIPKVPFETGHTPWNKGKKHTKDHAYESGNGNRGRKQSAEEIEKRRISLLANGDIRRTNFNRHSRIARKWSMDVRTRDKFTCQKCFNSPEELHAHHIKSWKDHKMLRHEISNGITLCIPCHKQIHREEDEINPPIPWARGKVFTEEHRKKLSDARKGKVPWNKGIKKEVDNGN